MISNKTVVHVTDMRTEKAYANRDPYIVAGVEQLGLFGPRTILLGADLRCAFNIVLK